MCICQCMDIWIWEFISWNDMVSHWTTKHLRLIRYSIFSLEYLSLGTLIVSHFKKICHLRWSYMALKLRHKIHESLLIFVNHSWRLWRIRLKLWLYLEKMFYYRVWWFHEYHYKWILASNANEWWSLPETWRGSNYKIFNIL